MNNKRKLFKVWLRITLMSVQGQLLTNWAGVLFLLGKTVRFLLFFVFLFSVLSSAGSLAGFNQEQVILIFLVFNLIDLLTQFFFRGVYQFRQLVVYGRFDLDLLKPLPSFFRPLFGATDILDFLVLVPLVVYTAWFGLTHQLIVKPGLFLLFLANSLVLGFALHLLVCAICVLTNEIDHLIWMYRDFISLARFPIAIYQKGVRWFLTFLVPIVILISVPAEALMGILTWPKMLLAFLITGVFLLVSWLVWRWSLIRYTSASS